MGWSESNSQLHRRSYRSVQTAAQVQAAAAVHAACLPFPSNLPQTHCTVSFFPVLRSAFCMHAGAKHGHHSRLAWKLNTLHLARCLFAWQSVHHAVLEWSLLHSSGQMGSFYRDRLSSSPVLTPVHLADHLHIGRGSAQCTSGLQLHSSVAITQRLASCGKAYSSFCVGSYCKLLCMPQQTCMVPSYVA